MSVLARIDLVPAAVARATNERLDRDFDEELTTHLELLIDEGRRPVCRPPERGARPSSGSAGLTCSVKCTANSEACLCSTCSRRISATPCA